MVRLCHDSLTPNGVRLVSRGILRRPSAKWEQVASRILEVLPATGQGLSAKQLFAALTADECDLSRWKLSRLLLAMIRQGQVWRGPLGFPPRYLRAIITREGKTTPIGDKACHDWQKDTTPTKR